MIKTRVCYYNRFNETAQKYKFASSDKSGGYDGEDKNYIRYILYLNKVK